MKQAIRLVLPIATALVAGSLIAADTDSSTHQNSSHSAATSSKQHSQNSGTTVSFNQLPQKVQKAMQAEAGNLNLENLQKTTSNGQTAYQASFDKPGMKARVTMGEDGSVLQYQETDRMALVSEVPKMNSGGEKLSELPQAVQKEVKQLAGKNTVGDISKDTESGKPIYHVAFNDEGIHTDLVLDQNGKVLLRSDETALFTEPLKGTQSLSFKTAPQAVQNAIREHAGTTANVTDIDKGTWQGQTAYKVLIQKNGSTRPLLISESGQVLQANNSSGSSSGVGSSASSEKSGGNSQTHASNQAHSSDQHSSATSTQNASSTHNSQRNANK
jgi:uncharacterized membrane protein YkoI